MVRRGVLLVVAASVLSACSQTISGTAVKTTPSEVGADLWNPCTQMPDEVIRAWGVDPASMATITDAPTGPVSARACGWQMPEQRYFVSVFSTIYELDKIKTNDQHYDFREVRVGPRRAIQSLQKSSISGDNCWVSMDSEQGMIEVAIGRPSTRKAPADMCPLANQAAAVLEPFIPK